MSERPISPQAQAELWGAEAKRLADAGHDVAAFDLYRRAADTLPGAPWLQQRTAELARKLKRLDVAVGYFRRSASAFRKAGFDKRGIAPLRQAWSVARELLPRGDEVFLEVTSELVSLFSTLGLSTDAESLTDYTDDALRRAGIKRSLTPGGSPTAQNDVRHSIRPTLSPDPL